MERYKGADIRSLFVTDDGIDLYRELSKKHHPDRGGDGKRFIRIAKAYETLTNEETRKNWEEYGNPDGPGGMHYLLIFYS